MAVVEDDQAGAHGSRLPPGQPAHLDVLDDDREAQSVIERVGNPALTFGNVAEVDSSMVVSDRALISRMIALAHELEGFARLGSSFCRRAHDASGHGGPTRHGLAEQAVVRPRTTIASIAWSPRSDMLLDRKKKTIRTRDSD
jgi:hypothetical protein